jgi:uncharacterized protein DUF4430
MKTSTRALTALITTALVALVPVAAAGAKAVDAQLRVEGGNGKALDPGTDYRTNTITAKSSSKCGPITENKHKLSGANAMGIVGDAASENARLDPFRVSDTFGFGLITCEIGKFGAFSSDEAWLYKVNHVAPDVGADQFKLERGDQVLWFFSNFATGANSGDELVLRAPGRVDGGESFEVKVHAFDFAGVRTPAAGVKIAGGDFPATDTQGRSTGKISSSRGFARLRGTRGIDIPTAPKVVCERGGKSCPQQ